METNVSKNSKYVESQKEDQFRFFLNRTSIGYLLLSETAFIIETNDAWLDLMNYSADDVAGRNFSDFLIEEDIEKFEDIFRKSMKDTAVLNAAFRMEKKDGSEIIVASTGYTLDAEEGSQGRLMCMILYETRQNRIGGIISEQEDSCRALMEESWDIIARYDRECRYEYVSSSIRNYLKSEPKDFIGKPHREMDFPRKLSEFMEERINTVFSTGSVIKDQYELETGRGRFVFDLQMFPEFGAGMQIQSVLSVSRDITELKIIEEQLRRERNRIQNYLDIAGVILVVIDSEQNVSLINKKGCEILGYEDHEIVGRNWIDLCIPEEKREFVGRIHADLLKGKIELEEYAENEVLTKDGEKRIIAWHNTVLRDKECRITGTLSSGEDITERKKAEQIKEKLEQQLFQSQKMDSIGRLAGGIAHDFNNILTGIMGCAELLKMQYPDVTTSEGEAAEVILKGAEKAADLTRQLLGFARGSAYNPVPLNINNVIKDTMNVWEKMFEKNIIISYDLDKDIQMIDADQYQLQQVIANLSINAKDSMPGGGKLIFSTGNVYLDEVYCEVYPEFKVGKYVKVSVSDTGTGIPREIKEYIFEPFFTTKCHDKGFGLGLATVYGIVKNHCGQISVTSEPGEGTTFTLYFPESKKSLGNEKEMRNDCKRGASILVVDDDKQIGELVKKMLGELGYDVLLAFNGQEAIDIYREKHDEIDIVLLDVILPGKTASETNAELHRINPDVKVLLSSGYSKNNRDAEQLLNNGDSMFIQKPYRIKDLSDIINKTLSFDKKR